MPITEEQLTNRFGKIIYNNRINNVLIISDLNKIDQLKISSFNRDINLDHVKNIENGLRNYKFITELQVVLDQNEYVNEDSIEDLNCYIIDGQHRYTAFKQIKQFC